MAGDDIMATHTQDDDITVHVEWLARRLTQQQEDAAATEQHRIMLNTLRVSRVPDHVRQHNPDAYTPGLVAIGPLHAADRRLRADTRLKMAYLNSLISRGHPDPASHLAVIQSYVGLVAGREREARAMYSAEDVNISAEDFIQMLVLDGCFIIEHLVNVATSVEEASLHTTPLGPMQLSVDLILAENQIPFFVLVDLIKSTKLPEFDTTGYQPTDLLMKLVLYYLAGEKGRDMNKGLPAANDVCHILHLLHAMVTAARTSWEPPPRLQDCAVYMLKTAQNVARLLASFPFLFLALLLYPTLPEECRWHATYGRAGLPSASNLKRMRMQFKKAWRGSTDKDPGHPAGIASLLGAVPLYVKIVDHFDRLQLSLSQLRFEFRTPPLLLNLMEFEKSDQHTVVSPYVWFIEKLVQSAEDARVLVAAEVLHIGTSNRENVARFFRQVDAAYPAMDNLEHSYLAPILEKMSSDQLLTRQADVLRYYVLVPWRLVAAFVTVVTTVATILQTYASFKQKP